MLSSILTGCSVQRTYEVNGRIVGFGDDTHTVIVEHEDIPGLMPAMTMSFQVPDTATLRAFSTNDAVRFTLVLTTHSSWIIDLEHLPDDAVAAHPAGRPDPNALPEAAPLLAQGDTLPAFTLLNQDAQPVQSDDFEGRILLLTFIYTRCPLPDFCPLLSRQFKTLQPLLLARYGDAIRQLSISFDPANDTPEVLRRYAARYTDNTTQWTFATGTPEEIGRLAHAFGVFYETKGVEFDHNLATALINPDGRIYRLWRGNDWKPDAVLEAVEDMLTEQKAP